jgi:hypothetical protein
LNGFQEHERRVTVQLLEQELANCRRLIGRALLDSEQYAIAKLSLFATFDQAEDLAVLRLPIAPNATRMRQYLGTLGRL